jgi:formylglycine-generating enzyme required for sulfatase activity
VRENPKDGLKYVWIPPGTFQMGCSPGDNECDANERPAHPVTISKGFWIGQTEVTVGAYKRFASQTARQMPGAPDFNSGWANDAMPIVNVSWHDAHAYCAWAGGRLPTEAEWEYAARGGSTQARYGNLDGIAWHDKNSEGQTRGVAQKRPNRFGLFDVLGNVWEWVSDWYGAHYYPNSPATDPQGPAGGGERVLRGGSWNNVPWVLRASYRGRTYPDDASDYIGVRCLREVNLP